MSTDIYLAADIQIIMVRIWEYPDRIIFQNFILSIRVRAPRRGLS